VTKAKRRNGVWKRSDRLSKAGVFEAFFDMLASISSSARRIQMFAPTIVRAHVSAAGARGQKDQALARLAHNKNLRKIRCVGRHHRLRPDVRL